MSNILSKISTSYTNLCITLYFKLLNMAHISVIDLHNL